MGLPSVCEGAQGARRMVKGEVRQVGGGTGKALVNATNARERAKAGTDNYSSPQNLGDSHVKILIIFA